MLRLRAQAEGTDTVRELEAVQKAADRAVRIAEQRHAQVTEVHVGGGVVDQVVHLLAGDHGALRVAEHRDVIAALQIRDEDVVEIADTRVHGVAETQVRLTGRADDRAELLRRFQAGEVVSGVLAEVEPFDAVEVGRVWVPRCPVPPMIQPSLAIKPTSAISERTPDGVITVWARAQHGRRERNSHRTIPHVRHRQQPPCPRTAPPTPPAWLNRRACAKQLCGKLDRYFH